MKNIRGCACALFRAGAARGLVVSACVVWWLCVRFKKADFTGCCLASKNKDRTSDFDQQFDAKLAILAKLAKVKFEL